MTVGNGWKNTEWREGRGTGGHVIVNFLFQVIFVFLLFLGMLRKLKQKEK